MPRRHPPVTVLIPALSALALVLLGVLVPGVSRVPWGVLLVLGLIAYHAVTWQWPRRSTGEPTGDAVVAWNVPVWRQRALVVLAMPALYAHADGQVSAPGRMYTAAVAVLCLAEMAAAWRRRPRLRLTPHGIERRARVGGWSVTWDELNPAWPLAPGSEGQRMRLHTADDSVWVPLGGELQSRLLHDMIRWYLHHPEERADIGTAPGHARMLAAIGQPRLAGSSRSTA